MVFYNKTANVAIFLLFRWALYYIRTVIIIDDDLMEVFYTLEKMYYTCRFYSCSSVSHSVNK